VCLLALIVCQNLIVISLFEHEQITLHNCIL